MTEQRVAKKGEMKYEDFLKFLTDDDSLRVLNLPLNFQTSKSTLVEQENRRMRAEKANRDFSVKSENENKKGANQAPFEFYAQKRSLNFKKY